MHTDKPTSKKSEDRFQRYEFSMRIASIITTQKIDKSLIVGLYGKWGEGKTSVMNFVQQELPKDTISVNFNPWMFLDEQHLLKSFFSILADALGEKINNGKEQFGKILADYGDAIGDTTEYIPKVGRSIKWLGKLGQKLSTVSIEKLKSRVDKMIRDSGKNIVVFVDDIDRLDIQEIQYVFKLVKLVGDFPRTAYVLSFDDEMVSSALAPKYGGDNKAAGYNFLEKIIQVPLKIPKASKKALYNYTADLINSVFNNAEIELSKEDVNDFTEAFNTAFLPFMDNPRTAIRYANSLAFSLPLLKGEVNLGNLVVIEGVKIFYPELYDFVRHNSYLFSKRTDSVHNYRTSQEQQKEIKDKIGASLSVYNADKQNAILELLQELFPQLKAVYSNTTYPESAYAQWTKEKKICSGKYFDRYFSYSVQEGDMPDNYFDQLLQDLQIDTINDLIIKFTNAIEQFDAFSLILKLRTQEEDIDEIQIKNLTIVLAKIGHLLPKEEDIHFATTYAQSAILIVRLLRKLPKSDQLSHAIIILNECHSFAYAMEINNWVMYRKKDDPETSVFTVQDEAKVKELLVTRFIMEANDENFFTILSDGNLREILSWWSKWEEKKEILQNFLLKHLGDKENSEFALKLLKVFTPTITSNSYSSSDKSVHTDTYKSGFHESIYNSVKEVVDVNLLNDNLISAYGMNYLDTIPSTISDHDPIDDQKLVSIFQWFIKNSKPCLSF